MRPLWQGKKQLKFLLIAIDYFTKWVEVEALATITKAKVRSFVWKNIVCRFKIPQTIISDNGHQFNNQGFKSLCSSLSIKNKYSSPRHPQANGQTKVTNQTLLKIIKARFMGSKGVWPEELPSVLWAYKTTVRTPIGETPFNLTYGIEIFIPVEIGLISPRTDFFDKYSNNNQLKLNLDCLDEVRDQASQRMAKYQQRMAEYYSQRVKLKRFHIGSLVLWKVTSATKDPAQGKLGPTWEGPYKVVHYSRWGSYHLEDLDGDKLPHPWNVKHLKRHYE